jgi:hypothetical protein
MTREQITSIVSSLSESIKKDESDESSRTTYKHLFTNKRTLTNLGIMTANWIGVNVAWFGLVKII